MSNQTHETLEVHLSQCNDPERDFSPYAGPGNDLIWSLARSISCAGDAATVYVLLNGFCRRFAEVPDVVFRSLEHHLKAIEEQASDRT